MAKSTKGKTEEIGDISTEYKDLKERAEEQQPGIDDLLEVYGKYLDGLQQNQEYLQLFRQTFVSSTSDASTVSS